MSTTQDETLSALETLLAAWDHFVEVAPCDFDWESHWEVQKRQITRELEDLAAFVRTGME